MMIRTILKMLGLIDTGQNDALSNELSDIKRAISITNQELVSIERLLEKQLNQKRSLKEYFVLPLVASLLSAMFAVIVTLMVNEYYQTRRLVNDIIPTELSMAGELTASGRYKESNDKYIHIIESISANTNDDNDRGRMLLELAYFGMARNAYFMDDTTAWVSALREQYDERYIKNGFGAPVRISFFENYLKMTSSRWDTGTREQIRHEYPWLFYDTYVVQRVGE